MGLRDFLKGAKKAGAKSQPSQQPLTPREVEELHAKLYPGTHKAYVWTPSKIFDTQDFKAPFQTPLGESSLATTASGFHGQSQSSLFRMLPRELRILIWSYAMPGQRIYLTTKKRSLKQADRMDDFGWWRKSGLLNVPLVCRSAYIESIDIPYSSNTFCIGFGHQGTKEPLLSIRTLLPSQHVACIQRLEVGWHFVAGYSQYFDSHPQAWDLSITVCEPDVDSVWLDVCAELVKLPALKSLRIIVWTSGDRRADMGDQEQMLLTPLLRLKRLQDFEIILPWAQNDADLWMNAPFHISRKFKNVERSGASIPVLESSR